MVMTRERLEQYRSNVQEIRELTDKIQKLGKDDSMIGNSVILDCRTGYPKPKSIVGYDYDLEQRRRERYENMRSKLQAECDMIEEFVFSIQDSMTRRIFQLYYLDGKSMDKVARKVHVDKSSVSRKIDNFFKVATNATNATL